MSNYTSVDFLVDPLPYSLEEIVAETGSRAIAQAAVEKVNMFANEWGGQHHGQRFEVDQVGGGCALFKREAVQKLRISRCAHPLGHLICPL